MSNQPSGLNNNSLDNQLNNNSLDNQLNRLLAMSTILFPNGLGLIFYVIEKDRFRIIPISDKFDNVFKRDNPLVDLSNCDIFGFTSYIQFLLEIKPNMH